MDAPGCFSTRLLRISGKWSCCTGRRRSGGPCRSPVMKSIPANFDNDRLSDRTVEQPGPRRSGQFQDDIDAGRGTEAYDGARAQLDDSLLGGFGEPLRLVSVVPPTREGRARNVSSSREFGQWIRAKKGP